MSYRLRTRYGYFRSVYTFRSQIGEQCREPSVHPGERSQLHPIELVEVAYREVVFFVKPGLASGRDAPTTRDALAFRVSGVLLEMRPDRSSRELDALGVSTSEDDRGGHIREQRVSSILAVRIIELRHGLKRDYRLTIDASPDVDEFSELREWDRHVSTSSRR